MDIVSERGRQVFSRENREHGGLEQGGFVKITSGGTRGTIVALEALDGVATYLSQKELSNCPVKKVTKTIERSGVDQTGGTKLLMTSL